MAAPCYDSRPPWVWAKQISFRNALHRNPNFFSTNKMVVFFLLMLRCYIWYSSAVWDDMVTVCLAMILQSVPPPLHPEGRCRCFPRIAEKIATYWLPRSMSSPACVAFLWSVHHISKTDSKYFTFKWIRSVSLRWLWKAATRWPTN